MKLIQGSMILRTGVYHAIKNATGSAVTNPRPKPMATEIILLVKSPSSASRSSMVFMPSITAGMKGKLRAVFSPMDRQNHTASATARETSSHSQLISLFRFSACVRGRFPCLLIRHLPLFFFIFRTCIHSRGMPDGRGLFSSDKEPYRRMAREINAAWRKKGRPGGVQRL